MKLRSIVFFYTLLLAFSHLCYGKKTGLSDSPPPSESTDPCSPNLFVNTVLKRHLATRNFARMTKSYFDRCGETLRARNSSHDENINEIFRPSESPSSEPGVIRVGETTIRNFILKMPNGMMIKGLIALKDQKRRPWIIAKCGVFCTVTAATSRSGHMLEIFNGLPFNIIFVSNRTAMDFIESNHRFDLGGYFEAEDLIYISQWLIHSSPYINIVDSIHLLGFSLGGAAAVFANNFISRGYVDMETRQYIKSVTALCPVTNLQPSLNFLFSNGIRGSVARNFTWQHLQKGRPFLSFVEPLLNINPVPWQKRFATLIGEMGMYFGKRQVNTLGKLPNPQNMEEYWKFNNYLAMARNVELPLFVWAGDDDNVVPTDQNAKVLENSVLAMHSPELGVTTLPTGGHCAFGGEYGHNVVISVLKAFILNNSPHSQY